MCGYILAINRQNFTEIYLAYVKILQEVLGGGYFFMTHTVFFTTYDTARFLGLGVLADREAPPCPVSTPKFDK